MKTPALQAGQLHVDLLAFLWINSIQFTLPSTTESESHNVYSSGCMCDPCGRCTQIPGGSLDRYERGSGDGGGTVRDGGGTVRGEGGGGDARA